MLVRCWPPFLTPKSSWNASKKLTKKDSFSSPGRDEFGLRAEWSGGVRAVRKSLLLAYQAWSRTRAQRSASQTRPSHAKAWSADSNAYAHSAWPGEVGPGGPRVAGRKQSILSHICSSSLLLCRSIMEDSLQWVTIGGVFTFLGSLFTNGLWWLLSRCSLSVHSCLFRVVAARSKID